MDLKSAIVTGASSGIGQAISAQLLQKGYRVWGIGHKQTADIHHPHYRETTLNLCQNRSIDDFYHRWKKEYRSLDLLVHSAGVGNFHLTEEASAHKLTEVLDLNLKVPILLSRIFIRPLLQGEGQIIFLNSITSCYPSHLGATYAASKAGLLRFADVLFQEHRKHGLRCCSILPGMVDTPFYQELAFEPTTSSEDCLDVTTIAQQVGQFLEIPKHSRPTRIDIPTQCNRVRKKKSSR